jgi:hypothetical protein
MPVRRERDDGRGAGQWLWSAAGCGTVWVLLPVPTRMLAGQTRQVRPKPSAKAQPKGATLMPSLLARVRPLAPAALTPRRRRVPA